MHTGLGVALRDAYHERRADERAELQKVDDISLLAAEQEHTIVRVLASSIAIDDDGPNYAPVPKRESTKARRSRQQMQEREKQAAAAARIAALTGAEAQQQCEMVLDASPVLLADGMGEAPMAVVCANHAAGRRASVLCDAFEEDEDEGAAGTGALLPRVLNPHGPGLSAQLRTLRKRLREYLREQTARGRTVSLISASGGLHPSMQWTIQFAKWFASHRKNKSHASCWDESQWGDEYLLKTTRGDDIVNVSLQHMKNQLWRELWPAMPEGANAREYWRVVTKQVMAMFDGGGGGMIAAASLVEQKTIQSARAANKT